MDMDPGRVRSNAEKAATEDLLDRVTVFRADMEPAAITILEAELKRRGITEQEIRDHAAQRAGSIVLPDGTTARCIHRDAYGRLCHRPAVDQGWGWHYFSLVIGGQRRPLFPLLPRYYYLCEEHRCSPRGGI